MDNSELLRQILGALDSLGAGAMIAKIFIVLVACAILAFAIYKIIDYGKRIIGEIVKGVRGIVHIVHIKRKESLSEIPEILKHMHDRLSLLVERNSQLIDGPTDDFINLWGMDESNYPELKQISPDSDSKAREEVVGKVIDKLASKITAMDENEIQKLLTRTGGLMNLRGMGISQIAEDDKEYQLSKKRLTRWQPELTPELNAAINSYLQYSFGSMSFRRLMLSIPNWTQLATHLPTQYQAELGIQKERLDAEMNKSLAKVTAIIKQQVRDEAKTEIQK